MATRPSSRQARTRQREQHILETARTLVSVEGFLALKMSDVAQAASVSVGTLYTHFESKEDLIMALATQTWRGRLAGFNAIFAVNTLSWAERLVAAVFVDFLFSVDHPELFAAEQLAATPSVWEGASERRTQEMRTLHHRIMDGIAQTAHQAIENGEFEPWADRKQQARAVDRGIWTLMLGSSAVWSAVSTLEEEVAADTVEIPETLQDLCQALFCGYGWRSPDASDDVRRLAAYCLQHGRFEPLPSASSNPAEQAP